MKLRTDVTDSRTVAPAKAGFASKAVLVGIIAAAGCTYEPIGLPVLDSGLRRDAVAEYRIPESGRGDSGSAERRNADALMRDSLPQDKTAADFAQPDSAKNDLAKADAKAACAAATTGSFSGIISQGTPHFVGGYRFDYKGLAGLDAHFDVSCGGLAIATGKKCPIGTGTIILVPSDGMKITITPGPSGPSTSSVSITVENS